MTLSPSFFSPLGSVRPGGRRRGVSELYASVLMIGVTLSFGSIVASAAVSQFQASTQGDSQSVLAQEASVGKQVALVYGTVVQGSGGCTATYVGAGGGTYLEGKSYVLALYDYGSASFAPAEVFDNGTLLPPGGYAVIAADGPGPVSDSLALAACARPSGQTFLLVDASGDELTVAT